MEILLVQYYITERQCDRQNRTALERKGRPFTGSYFKVLWCNNGAAWAPAAAAAGLACRCWCTRHRRKHPCSRRPRRGCFNWLHWRKKRVGDHEHGCFVRFEARIMGHKPSDSTDRRRRRRWHWEDVLLGHRHPGMRHRCAIAWAHERYCNVLAISRRRWLGGALNRGHGTAPQKKQRWQVNSGPRGGGGAERIGGGRGTRAKQ
jgi:hypothetical protein